MIIKNNCFFSLNIRNYIVIVSIFLIILFFLIVGTHSLSKSGLYYDEVLFVNAALGGIKEKNWNKRWNISNLLHFLFQFISISQTII